MKILLVIGIVLSLAGVIPAAAMTDSACDAASAYSEKHRGVAVLVLHNGEVVCRRSGKGGEAASHELWSGTKSFLGVMAAAAVQDKLLSLDEPASTTIVEWTGDNRKASITIRQLLSMTSGLGGKIGEPPSYKRALEEPLLADPGTTFIYSPPAMQVFGEVMRRKLAAAGVDSDPVAYLDQRVLEPAGIRVSEWRRGPDGNPLMPQGAIMTAEQWARFGEIIRNGGRIGDRLLVDPAAFAELFKGSKANPAYGLTWWLAEPTSQNDPVTATSDIPENAANLPGDLVYAAGAGGQRLYIIPSRKLTIVRLARLDIIAALAGKKSGWSDTRFLEELLKDEE